jgi:hypothetical protein
MLSREGQTIVARQGAVLLCKACFVVLAIERQVTAGGGVAAIEATLIGSGRVIPNPWNRRN